MIKCRDIAKYVLNDFAYIVVTVFLGHVTVMILCIQRNQLCVHIAYEVMKFNITHEKLLSNLYGDWEVYVVI